MKFKNLLFVFALLLQASFLFSQPPVPGYDLVAKKILDGVAKKMDIDSTKTAAFTIITIRTDRHSDTINGKMQLKQDKFKIVLKRKSIITEEFYFDGEVLVTYAKKDGSIISDSIWGSNSDSPDVVIPRYLFTIFKKGFKYKFINEDTLDGHCIEHIDLYPNHPEKKNFHTLHISIDKEKQQIIEFVYIVNDGTCDILRIDTFIPNLPVPDETFRFDPRRH